MDWPGNPCLQQLQLTPTSSDPLVAALFGIECQRFGKAVLLLAKRDDFPGLETGNANWLEAIEQEIVVPLAPAEFFPESDLRLDRGGTVGTGGAQVRVARCDFQPRGPRRGVEGLASSERQ